MTPEILAQTHAAANTVDAAWSAKEFAELLASPLIFMTGDNTTFCLARVVADEAEILTVATHPDHQNQGRARKVLTAFEITAQSRGATTAYLEVAADNVPAIALYTACRYQKTGLRKAYYLRSDGQKIDAVLMSKALTKG